ncbi:tetratricopeptide repeat protein [Candidatus Uhrbacteria bacterium]|nr:tetratricopeptide repeat protein [Candidatus Uhrbacteria bacterium]
MPFKANWETVARWSVFLLFGLLPFFFLPLPFVTVAQSKMLLIGIVGAVALGAWTLSSFSEGVLRIEKSWILLSSALLPIAYLISALVSGLSWESVVGSGTSLDTVAVMAAWFALTLVSASVLGVRYERVVLALRILLIGSVPLLVIQLLHLFFSLSFGGALETAASSIVGSWHDFNILMGLVVFVSLASLGLEGFRSALFRVCALSIGILGSAMLFVINFKDVWIGLAALALFQGFFLFRSRHEPSSGTALRAPLLWLLLALISLGLYWGGAYIHDRLPAPIQVVQFEVRPSWKGTIEVGRGAFSEYSDIFFGSGPNSFSRVWGLHKPLEVNATQFWNSDFYTGVGFIPTSLVTVGILSLIAWGGVALALVVSLSRALTTIISGVAQLRFIVAASAAYLLGYQILYAPGPALTALLFLFLGALIALELLSGTVRDSTIPLSLGQWNGRIAMPAIALAVLLLLFGAVQALRALSSDLLVNHAIYVFESSQDPERASRSIAQALRVLSQNDRAHRAAVELGILQMSRLGSGSDARERLQATLTATIQHGLAAVSIESRNYQNWLSLARLYGELAGVGVEGAEGEARAAYAEAIKNNPTTPAPYLGIAQLELLKGNDTAAEASLEKALTIKRDFAPAHFLLSQILARGGNLERAREHATLVVQVAPEDALGWYNLGTILYAGRDFTEAALALERAVGLNNNYANALYLLGLSYNELGKHDDALNVLRALAALTPSDEIVKETIRRIEEGEFETMSQ